MPQTELHNGNREEWEEFQVFLHSRGAVELERISLAPAGVPCLLRVFYVHTARVLILDQGVHGWQVFFPPTSDTTHQASLDEFSERCDFIRRGLMTSRKSPLIKAFDAEKGGA